MKKSKQGGSAVIIIIAVVLVVAAAAFFLMKSDKPPTLTIKDPTDTTPKATLTFEEELTLHAKANLLAMIHLNPVKMVDYMRPKNQKELRDKYVNYFKTSAKNPGVDINKLNDDIFTIYQVKDLKELEALTASEFLKRRLKSMKKNSRPGQRSDITLSDFVLTNIKKVSDTEASFDFTGKINYKKKSDDIKGSLILYKSNNWWCYDMKTMNKLSSIDGQANKIMLSNESLIQRNGVVCISALKNLSMAQMTSYRDNMKFATNIKALTTGKFSVIDDPALVKAFHQESKNPKARSGYFYKFLTASRKNQFMVIAYPEEQGVSGKYIYLTTEQGVVYQKFSAGLQNKLKKYEDFKKSEWTVAK